MLCKIQQVLFGRGLDDRYNSKFHCCQLGDFVARSGDFSTPLATFQVKSDQRQIQRLLLGHLGSSSEFQHRKSPSSKIHVPCFSRRFPHLQLYFSILVEAISANIFTTASRGRLFPPPVKSHKHKHTAVRSCWVTDSSMTVGRHFIIHSPSIVLVSLK